jgi:hypothetical protein
MPHLEFVVAGPPVSYQTTDRAKLKAWQAVVKLEAMKVWAMPPLTGNRIEDAPPFIQLPE